MRVEGPIGAGADWRSVSLHAKWTASGMAFWSNDGGRASGSSLGVILMRYIGWRMLFAGVAAISFDGVCSACAVWPTSGEAKNSPDPLSGRCPDRIPRIPQQCSWSLSYRCVLVNSLFHSGVYLSARGRGSVAIRASEFRRNYLRVRLLHLSG